MVSSVLSENYDLIVLDLNLPGMDGMERGVSRGVRSTMAISSAILSGSCGMSGK